jgi:hypothetical protein
MGAAEPGNQQADGGGCHDEKKKLLHGSALGAMRDWTATVKLSET